ncbi:phosphate ABC transporter permease subunit PstC [Citreimonas salinaria]|uniref:Phosphate transport system permease protein n=1 Tax=Citreimonas salinaria TaxID=321339 RepID=A0A1H3IFD2_9RHOB|nr:phosphate ABC transporter permease subunit PstC [Citreimonas salinaria]SDY26400.1 phosphate ABC transporter membrane protein 1, PhoT family [Citreimonas salinaria]
MPVLWLVLIVATLALGGFFAGRRRALSDAGGDHRRLHSLPAYYGWNAALKVAVPAAGVLTVWLLAQPLVVGLVVVGDLPQDVVTEGSSMDLVMSEVRRTVSGLEGAVAAGVMSPEEARSPLLDAQRISEALREAGQIVSGQLPQPVISAAQQMRQLDNAGDWLMSGAALAAALAGLLWALRETGAAFRARNAVENGLRAVLVAAASLAVLTTLGIVLSLIFNTVEFFRIYPASEFFGSLTWSPSFGGRSELGIWPLLWGTLYISLIALIVAVPIGLFAAIYLSEYASRRVRSVVKPLLEVLAGIPTIVYGLFALLTVGPLLMEVFGNEGLGWMRSGTAVMTAGLVMGIMLIPFVSSLSDDIINAVPQSLRDGSYGLGATQSETIRKVILPAALPGIVGAILLATSRAIGETMIVVLGAGAAARLSLNPFDAMTTITAKIVSQLTGDADFSSPEALVAFALGMTLFVITLALNIVALVVVRKYREQYE